MRFLPKKKFVAVQRIVVFIGFSLSSCHDLNPQRTANANENDAMEQGEKEKANRLYHKQLASL